MSYILQNLIACDEEDFAIFGAGTLPAYWQSRESGAKSIFDDLDILLRELKSEPAYKIYFDKKA